MTTGAPADWSETAGPVPGAADIGTVLVEFQKNSREIVRIIQKEYQGIPIIDIRVWYLGLDGDWKPSHKGFAIRESAYGELQDAVNLAAEALPGESS